MALSFDWTHEESISIGPASEQYSQTFVSLDADGIDNHNLFIVIPYAWTGFIILSFVLYMCTNWFCFEFSEIQNKWLPGLKDQYRDNMTITLKITSCKVDPVFFVTTWH